MGVPRQEDWLAAGILCVVVFCRRSVLASNNEQKAGSNGEKMTEFQLQTGGLEVRRWAAKTAPKRGAKRELVDGDLIGVY